jgi:hypothetical protein
VFRPEIAPEFSVWSPADTASFITQEERRDDASNKFSPQSPTPRPDVVHFLLFTPEFIVLNPKWMIPSILLKHIIGTGYTDYSPNNRQRRPRIEPLTVLSKVYHSANLGMRPRSIVFPFVGTSPVLTKPNKISHDAVLCGVN